MVILYYAAIVDFIQELPHGLLRQVLVSRYKYSHKMIPYILMLLYGIIYTNIYYKYHIKQIK